MRNKKKYKKAKETPNEVIMASVTEEMAQPRVAESAKVAANEQRKKRYGKPTRHHAEGAAKTHIEQYGTGTPPTVKKVLSRIRKSRASVL